MFSFCPFTMNFSHGELSSWYFDGSDLSRGQLMVVNLPDLSAMLTFLKVIGKKLKYYFNLNSISFYIFQANLFKVAKIMLNKNKSIKIEVDFA